MGLASWNVMQRRKLCCDFPWGCKLSDLAPRLTLHAAAQAVWGSGQGWRQFRDWLRIEVKTLSISWCLNCLQRRVQSPVAPVCLCTNAKFAQDRESFPTPVCLLSFIPLFRATLSNLLLSAFWTEDHGETSLLPQIPYVLQEPEYSSSKCPPVHVHFFQFVILHPWPEDSGSSLPHSAEDPISVSERTCSSLGNCWANLSTSIWKLHHSPNKESNPSFRSCM